MFRDAEIIYKYTREQALADGVLIDVTTQAKEAGFKFPVAITAGVLGTLTPPKRSYESFEGRLWDVLMILAFHIKVSTTRGSQIDFTVRIGRKNVQLKSLCHPGDNMEPVITILLPNED